MKTKKSLLLLSAIGTISVLSLTACGVSGSGETEIGKNPFVDLTLPEDDPTSQVTIQFWHCLGHDKETNLNEKIIKPFNEKYKGKYFVEAKKLNGDYDSLSDGLKTSIAAGDIPALTMGYPDNFSTYMSNDIDDSAILRLDNFINDEKFGYTKAELDDFIPAFYQEGKDYQFPGTWSMPMYKSTEVMYYNANYFAGDNDVNAKKFNSDNDYKNKVQTIKSQAANVTDEELAAFKTWVKGKGGYTYDIPTTWEDMIATARKMKADRAAEGVNTQFFPVGYDSDANLLITQFAMLGIPYTTNENINDAKDHIQFNNAEAKKVVSDIVDLYKKEKLMITKGLLGGQTYTNTYFNSLQSAMSIGSTGGSSYQVSSNFKVGIAPVPTPAGKKARYIQQGPSICFFNNDDNYIHKGAWLFYKALAEPEANAKLALENSYDPVRKSSFETQSYKSHIALKDKGLNYAIPAATALLRNDYMTSSVFVGSETARQEIGSVFKYIINNGYTVDQAFNVAYNNVIKAL